MKTIFLSNIFLFVISYSFSQVPSYIPTNGLIGYWPFNGNANDESGNGNNGNLQGTISYQADRFGNLNSAVKFNSTTDIICTQNLYNNPNNFTISIWVKSNANSPGEFLFGLNNGQCVHGGDWDRTLYLTENQLGFFTYNGFNNYMSGNGMFKDGLWHQFTVTLGVSGRKIFVDGQLFIQDNTTSGQNYSGFWRIGGLSPNDANNSSTSFYDEFTIWNRILTQQEISTLYASSSTNLPVELVSFEGICDASNVSILWQTASEHNSKSFELEKSRNGEDWFLIDQQAAAENSTVLTTYAFKEASENNVQIIYYRLRQIDINGETKLYGPIAIKCDNQFTTDFNILANPTNCSVPIQFNNLIPLSDNLIEINSLNGSTLIKKQFNTNSAALFLELDVSSLVKGTYFVTLNKNASTTQRLLLE